VRRCEEPGCSIRLRRDQPGDRCNHHLRAAPSPRDEEFEAALWRATDRSLEQDPTRWVIASAAANFSTRSRSDAEDAVTPYRERDPDAVRRGQESWEKRRARQAADADES
jgi:hypothetical protein